MNLKKDKKEKIIIPKYITHPIPNAEKGDEKDMEDAVEIAKKWVEEHKL